MHAYMLACTHMCTHACSMHTCTHTHAHARSCDRSVNYFGALEDEQDADEYEFMKVWFWSCILVNLVVGFCVFVLSITPNIPIYRYMYSLLFALLLHTLLGSVSFILLFLRSIMSAFLNTCSFDLFMFVSCCGAESHTSGRGAPGPNDAEAQHRLGQGLCCDSISDAKWRGL